MNSPRARIGLLGLVLAAGLLAPGAATAAPLPEPGTATGAATTRAASAPGPTAEERRLDGAVPREILRRSGFDGVAPRFERALRAARSYGEARGVAVREGARLWRLAVDRAQRRGTVAGDLSGEDDRPLYWSRLAMTRELRAWKPAFRLTGSQRAALLERVERTSRGQESVRYPRRDGTDGRRVLVTGFDPFTLDRDIRISNPSGASALALDGTTVRTAKGPARVEAVVFPVRWDDFAEGTVERVLRRWLPRVDLFTTLSQGRIGRFDVERTNGAWRGGALDNANVSREGTVPVTDPASRPQWTSTTLPYGALTAAETGRFPVRDNTEVTEIPAGATEPVVRPDGPTPGSTARAGGGGDYLSNEIAYRATLLRDRLGLHDTLPGGHLHTPVLQFAPDNADPASGEITDPAFVRNRRDIVDQVRSLVTTAADNVPVLTME